MAIALRQFKVVSAAAGDAIGNKTANWPASTISGSLLVSVLFARRNAGYGSMGVPDNYSKIFGCFVDNACHTSESDQDRQAICQFSIKPGAASESTTDNCYYGDANYGVTWVFMEITGAATGSNPYSAQHQAVGNTNAPSNISETLSQADSLLISGFTIAGNNPLTHAAGTGWTTLTANTDGSNLQSNLVAWKIVSSTTSVTSSATAAAAACWLAQMIGIKQA